MILSALVRSAVIRPVLKAAIQLRRARFLPLPSPSIS
jgi:hypothetical protein